MRQSQERRPTFKKRSLQASVKQAIKYLFKVSFFEYWRLQFPKVDEVPDSERYLATYVPKENAAKATWTLLSKKQRPDRKTVRKPVIIMGRRMGIVGSLILFLALTLSLSLIRTVLLP